MWVTNTREKVVQRKKQGVPICLTGFPKFRYAQTDHNATMLAKASLRSSISEVWRA